MNYVRLLEHAENYLFESFLGIETVRNLVTRWNLQIV